MRILIIIATALFAAPALAFDDPGETLGALYTPYLVTPDASDFSTQDELQSVGLKALFDADAAEANGEMGRIDFDVYIQGQDWDTTEVVVRTPVIMGGTARANVEFTNFGRPITLTYSLVLERDGWKVDDVYWPADGEWPEGSLREILTGPLP